MTRLAGHRWVWLCSLFLTVPACTDDGISGPPSVTLGTGDLEFQELNHGDSIFVVQGPQNGFHVVASVRTRNLVPGDPESLQHPKNPTTEFRVFAGETRVDARASSYVQGLEAVSDSDQHQMVGRLVILMIEADDELDNVEIRLEVEVTDVDGRRASDVRELLAVPHPNNQ